MKGGMLIVMLLAVSGLAFTQSKQETKSESSPNVTQTQIVELPSTQLPEILILTNQAVLDKKGRCRVHHHPLKVATIPVTYGLLPGTNKESYYQAEAKEFPNAITHYEGGCTIMSAKEARVLQCQKCLDAQKDWVSRQIGVLGWPNQRRQRTKSRP